MLAVCAHPAIDQTADRNACKKYHTTACTSLYIFIVHTVVLFQVGVYGQTQHIKH
jgi:hypothetical protein